MEVIGQLSILLAFGFSIYATIIYTVGISRRNSALILSGRGAVFSLAFLVVLSSVLLWYGFLDGAYNIKYVYGYSSNDLPLIYKLTSFWAGNKGSLLLWELLLAVYTAIIAFKLRKIYNKYIANATVVLLIINIFFLGLLAFIANPFETYNFTPPDGSGLNPMLQNPGMVFHPLTLYLGYVGVSVPFAFAISALITKRTDDWWIRNTRKWAVWAWVFLSLGNILGGIWAYVELGWGGYWAWDPVENSSFIPWLILTAYIHSVIIQERKNMLKIWNVSLIIFAFLATLFGTFLTRSGVFASVHSFSDSPLGFYFLMFMFLVLVVSLGLMFSRMGHLTSGKEFESYVSKESSFLFNNLFLVGGAFAVFLGTVFPIISEALRGVKVSVSVPWYNQIMAPILLGVVLLMGICPLIAWHKSSKTNFKVNFLLPVILSLSFFGVIFYFLEGEKLYAAIAFTICFFAFFTTVQEFVKGMFARSKITGEMLLKSLVLMIMKNRRRYGGYIVHIGIILITFGIIGSQAFSQEMKTRLAVGQKAEIGNYEILYKGLQKTEIQNGTAIYANLAVFKNDKFITTARPEKVFYSNSERPFSEVSIHSTLKEDLYIVLQNWLDGGKAADLMFKINPLVIWMWIGSFILTAGGLLALWPGKGSQLNPKMYEEVSS